MKLNTFIHGTADEELMKSMYKDYIDSGKEPPEELMKAMDKAGLVQVQRTVNGKHGQYTRMQWVKSSDVKDSDKVVGKKNDEPDEDKKTDKEDVEASDIKKLDPDEDSEMTVADYATDDYLDEDEIEQQKSIAKEMGADPEDVHIYTSDTVQDTDNFDKLFSYVSENMKNPKEIGGFKVGKVKGKNLAYQYAEGGLQIIYALD